MPFYTADGSPAPLVWDLGLLAEPSQLAIARWRVAETSRQFRLDDARTRDVVLAVNEAVTNAIRHGRPDRVGRIRIKALATSERLTFAVSDYGIFVEPREELDPLSAGGRGFHLMSQLVDEVTVHKDTNGTTVTLSKERT